MKSREWSGCNSVGSCLRFPYQKKVRADLLVGPISVSWLLCVCVTCDMCLKEVRDTAQAGSLALLPTTPRGGVGWGGRSFCGRCLGRVLSLVRVSGSRSWVYSVSITCRLLSRIRAVSHSPWEGGSAYV